MNWIACRSLGSSSTSIKDYGAFSANNLWITRMYCSFLFLFLFIGLKKWCSLVCFQLSRMLHTHMRIVQDSYQIALLPFVLAGYNRIW